MRFLISFLILCTVATSCENGRSLTATKDQVRLLTLQDSVRQVQFMTMTDSLQEFAMHSRQIAAENVKYKADLLELTKSRDQLARQLTETNKLFDDQSVSLNDIRKRIFSGLHEIQDTGITVLYLNGMVSISMQDQFTFRSGSTNINKGALRALRVISNVLSDYPQVRAIIVGHTDSVRVSSDKFIDNWSLSTERSNIVARLLIRDLKIDPSRIVVVGKGRYDPVASNQTESGRKKNRRTDIILNPDLSRLWLLSQKYP